MIPKKYRHENVEFTEEHNDPSCTKDVYICPKCKNFGHSTRHLDITKNAYIDIFNINESTRIHAWEVITHGCFTKQKDIGRNVSCYINEITVSPDEVYITMKLKREDHIPSWIIEKQKEHGEFMKLMKENSQNMMMEGFHDD